MKSSNLKYNETRKATFILHVNIPNTSSRNIYSEFYFRCEQDPPICNVDFVMDFLPIFLFFFLFPGLVLYREHNRYDLYFIFWDIILFFLSV